MEILKPAKNINICKRFTRYLFINTTTKPTGWCRLITCQSSLPATMCHLGYDDMLHSITRQNIFYGTIATICKRWSDSNSITGNVLNTFQGLLTLGMKLYAANANMRDS
jgi:hypothetical protein